MEYSSNTNCNSAYILTTAKRLGKYVRANTTRCFWEMVKIPQNRKIYSIFILKCFWTLLNSFTMCDACLAKGSENVPTCFVHFSAVSVLRRCLPCNSLSVFKPLFLRLTSHEISQFFFDFKIWGEKYTPTPKIK
jgi:hypothetical protein